MGTLYNSDVALAKSFQSELFRRPVRNAWLSMPAVLERMRSVSCSQVISKLKMTVGIFCRRATLVAMFSAKLVLPIPGRAARIIRSERPRPVRILSR